MKKNRVWQGLSYVWAPLMVMGMLLLVFHLREVYPFGPNTVDTRDMGQGNAAMYHHVYDALRGNKSMLYDWYSSLGINMSASVGMASFLSPFNLFFLFVKRDFILQSLSFFTMIKMMSMSAALFVFLHKTFPRTHVYWKVLFGVGYAFCGYALQYYTNSQWLDIAAFFPILILAFLHLLKKEKVLPYLFMLTLCLAVNFYISFMVCLFLFFTAGLYIFIKLPKEKRGKAAFLFGISSVTAAALSAAVLLPSLLQVSQSPRLSGDISILENMKRIDFDSFEKWFMLFGSVLTMVILIKCLSSLRRDKGTLIMAVAVILLVGLPICFENINLLWHMGSYVAFPLRFGFMISFAFSAAACYGLSRTDTLGTLSNTPWAERAAWVKILSGVCLAGGIYFLFRVMAKVYGYALYENLGAAKKLFFVFFVAYCVLFLKKNRYVNYRAAALLFIPMLMWGSYVYVPLSPSIRRPAPEQTSFYITETLALQEALAVAPSSTERIKVLGGTLNNNYPFVMERASSAGWTHTCPDDLLKNFRALGYSNSYTRLVENGGTVFTDAFFNMTEVLSIPKADEKLYTLKGETETYSLYDSRYVLPYGIVVPEGIKSLTNQHDDSFDFQNALFKAFGGTELIEKRDAEPTVALADDRQKEVLYTFDMPENSVLYVYGISFSQATVNGETLAVPSMAIPDNKAFPVGFNNHLLCLGAFDRGIAEVRMTCPEAFDEKTPQFGILKLDELETFIARHEGDTAGIQAKGRTMTLTAKGTAENKTLVLPLMYDAGWSCKVNGQKAEIAPIAGIFMGIDLPEGENSVTLRFRPEGLLAGTVISLCALGMLLICFFINRVRKIEIPKIVCTLTGAAFAVVWSLGVLGVYVFPIIYGVFFSG